MRRNFIIVDDMPLLADQLEDAISAYYAEKQVYDYIIKKFTKEDHFTRAKTYIQEVGSKIDIVFSDQNLSNGTGTDLFKACEMTTKFGLHESHISSHIYKVLHSDEYKRLSELQGEHKILYDYFVNSIEPKGIYLFLDFYEKTILPRRYLGNKGIHEMYEFDAILKSLLRTERIILDTSNVFIKDILLLVRDVYKSRGDYFFIYYRYEQSVKVSENSICIQSDFNAVINQLCFIKAHDTSQHRKLLKINPLWVSSIDTVKQCLKLFLPNSTRLEILYSDLDAEVLSSITLDDLFYK